MKTPSQRAKASQSKGKRGELEIAHLYQEYGIPATTGRQHSGSPDSPDILMPKEIRNLVHNEVKRCETLHIRKWLKQVEDEVDEGVPYVLFFRQKGEPWRVVIDARFFIRLFCGLISSKLLDRWAVEELEL